MRLLPSGRVDVGSVLSGLRERGFNYDPAEVRPPRWVFDVHRHELGREDPGPPEEGGLWARARELVADYEFTPPELIRAHYLRGTPLLGRDMVLEGRLWVLRFLMGVRITDVRDEASAERTLWGWSYETLHGHLERGRVDYELVKHHASGVVEFLARSHSQLHPCAPWWIRTGWRVLGRRTQLRFYRRAGARLRALSRPGGRVVTVPTDVRHGRWGVSVTDPVTGRTGAPQRREHSS